MTSEISFSNYTNYSLYEPTTLPIINPPCQWTCELTNDAGYVVYSAFGSFYIPMFVMLFFYWRIYRAAVRTTRAINQGFRTTKGKSFFILYFVRFFIRHYIDPFPNQIILIMVLVYMFYTKIVFLYLLENYL